MDSFAEKKVIIVDQADGIIRLDMLLANRLPSYSRSFFKNLIDDGKVLVNGSVQTKAGLIVQHPDEIIVYIPDFLALKKSKDVSTIDAQVIFEHPDFIIINKGAGVLVHAPHDKCDQLTLVDWLVERFREITEVGSPERPGIVHRLDMDTSGIMVIPRTNYAHKIFGDMFKNRHVQKTYLALVEGHPDQEGVIEFPIARHPVIKTKMTHVPQKEIDLDRYHDARSAHTSFNVVHYFEHHTLVQVKPTTGRTHQIRVHFAAIGHPLLGDSTYGQASLLLPRHALHASSLEFEYGGQMFSFEQEPPIDMRVVMKKLKSYQF